MSTNQPYYFFNNKIVQKSQVLIGVDDIGFLRSYAVFDYLKTYFSEPFHLTDHINRFYNSAHLIGVDIPLKPTEIKEIIYELIKINLFPESSLRIIVTGGSSPDGKLPGKPNLIIGCEPRNEIPKIYYATGVKIKSIKDYREAPEIKTVNYTMAIKYLKDFQPKGFFEVLYVNNNLITECTSSNIFFIKGKKLLTPKFEILFGITRKIVLTLAKEHFDVEERDIYFHEISDFDESFITSTDKEVLPVISIDNQEFNKGQVGNHTKFIMRLFQDYVESKIWFER